MALEITFDCGRKASGVVMPGMAIRAHIGQCQNRACQIEVKQAAEKYRNVQVD